VKLLDQRLSIRVDVLDATRKTCRT